MFAVIFEVHPQTEKWETYLDLAKMLKPEIAGIDGFVDNVRYRSLTRDGWLLSLSGWRDEKALVRWRTHAGHHGVQERGRDDVLRDYHLRVGQITSDTHVPEGHELREQRLDVTETGSGTAVTFIDTQRTADWVKSNSPDDIALSLGLKDDADGLLGWEVFDAVLSPGHIILQANWRNPDSADAFTKRGQFPGDTRLRTVRVVRDYGMFDRREAPQFYPEATHTNRD